MSRRSIAFDHGLGSDLLHSTPVSHVNTTHIALQNDTIITLGSGDKIILAAGALVSPQLLNYTSFSGYNHYFIYNTPVNSVSEQSIEYTRPYEINRANYNQHIFKCLPKYCGYSSVSQTAFIHSMALSLSFMSSGT